MEKILVIEDDAAVQRALRRTFETAGFDVAIASDGTMAMETFRATMPRIVILDLRLPGKSGQDICREIKQECSTVPILVLSAASDVLDKVLLLELGADDYVTKPFSPRELLARVRATFRRLNQASDKVELFSFDEVEVNFSKMELHRNG
jgi:DNA-binding response OmpR family regulator